MSTARQIMSLPRAGSISLADQFAIWQRGRTTICDVNDLLAFLQIGLAGPKGDKGDKGDPGASVIVTPGGEVDTAALNFPTLATTNASAKAATTQFVRRLTGSDIGVSWQPFETRLLITKDHQPGEHQPIFDIQTNTRAGTIDGGGGIGSGVSIVSRGLPDTKYGHFNLIALFENYSVQNEADPGFGHVAFAPYINLYNTNNVSSWAIAAECREKTNAPDPIHGALCCEFTNIATGTDNNNKRCAVFLPTNKVNPFDGIFTEFAQGIYWKTGDNTKYKDGMLLEGKYDRVLNARGVDAGSLVTATGTFSGTAIDLHAISSTFDGGAISINPAHSLQWRDASNVFKAGIGHDVDTILFSGIKQRGSSGGSRGFLEVNIDGTRVAIPIFNLA